MRNVKVEKVEKNVIVIRPVYRENGNVTELWQSSGEIYYDKRGIDGVIKALARHNMLDLKSQREKLRHDLQRGSVLPFYLPDKRVFIPLKMREALTVKDKRNGYIDVQYIDVVTPFGDNNCLLKLANGKEIVILSPKKTADANHHLGMQLWEKINKDTVNKDDFEEKFLIGMKVFARILLDINKKINH